VTRSERAGAPNCTLEEQNEAKSETQTTSLFSKDLHRVQRSQFVGGS